MRGHGSTRRRSRRVGGSPAPTPTPTPTPASSPLRVVATRGEVPQPLTPVVTNPAQLRRIFRTQHHLGGRPATELRLAFGNYAASGSGEVAPGNVAEVQAAIEFPGGSVAVVRATFAGALAHVMADGEGLVLSDPIGPGAFGLAEFPANAEFWVRRSHTIPLNGRSLRADQSAGVAGEGAAQCADTTDPQMDAAGPLLTAGAYAAFSEIVRPLAILGRTSEPQVSVAGIGDSILFGRSDLNGDGINGRGGWFQRGLASLGRIPNVRLACPGERGQAFAGATGARRRLLLPYFTHAVCNYGTNDLGGGRNPTQVAADLRTIWGQCKAAGIGRVEQVLMLPRASASTDGYASVAGQTVAANYQVGGMRDAINAVIGADVGAHGLDAAIDLHTDLAADAAQPDRWAANGTANHATSDGVHPSPGLHGRMATAFAQAAANWSVG